jgi:hypothetical protein
MADDHKYARKTNESITHYANSLISIEPEPDNPHLLAAFKAIKELLQGAFIHSLGDSLFWTIFFSRVNIFLLLFFFCVQKIAARMPWCVSK